MLDGLFSNWHTVKSATNLHPAQKPTRSCHRLPIVMGGTLNLISDAHAESDTNDLPMYTSHSQVNKKVVTFLFLILGNVRQCPKKLWIKMLTLAKQSPGWAKQMRSRFPDQSCNTSA